MNVLPRVIVHNALSIDGRLDGFAADLGVYYGLISRWHEDATLVGAGTVLRATQSEPPDEAPSADARDPEPSDTRPLLVIPDSRGRVRTWQAVRRAGYWRDCVALVSHATPAEYLEYLGSQRVQTLVHGEDHVDVREALEELRDRFAVRTVRVDSGGTLIRVLLLAGLVDEISLLVHPVLVGGGSGNTLFASGGTAVVDEPIHTRLESVEQLDNGLVWLRYRLGDVALTPGPVVEEAHAV